MKYMFYLTMYLVILDMEEKILRWVHMSCHFKHYGLVLSTEKLDIFRILFVGQSKGCKKKCDE